MIELLSLGGFQLEKLASNSWELLTFYKRIIFWAPKSGTFPYHTELHPSANSKRMILLSIEGIFDPIGGAALVFFWAKCFLGLKIVWEDPLPESV
ncbi:hypothetical protein J437_LFUL019434 [Ladona fulva]|uniref:Uncharacterized protein n=1 Tax=Ladona fulva TaxID=123851 RepID=A0A8K0P8B3_LADFU|nr:hypothetical protein J437_LFUL019434 [Ladona fulva]